MIIRRGCETYPHLLDNHPFSCYNNYIIGYAKPLESAVSIFHLMTIVDMEDDIMKLRTSEVEKLQEEWGGKPCKHNKGWGHEIDDATGCDCDCFCRICGMRYADPSFFEERMEHNQE